MPGYKVSPGKRERRQNSFQYLLTGVLFSVPVLWGLINIEKP